MYHRVCNFQPQMYDDKVLFHEQQHYLYAVFVCILKTDKGKASIRKYKSSFDAQSIYRDCRSTLPTPPRLLLTLILCYSTLLLHVLMMACGMV